MPKVARQKNNPRDKFLEDGVGADEKPSPARIRALKNGLIFSPKEYEFNEDFVAANLDNPLEIHTTGELVEALKKNKNYDVEARVVGVKNGESKIVRMNKEQFLEANKKKDSKKLREAVDAFMFDDMPLGNAGSLIGHDFTPLLGGPFNKQLYYRDYLRMHAACFFAYHHDPVPKDLVEILVDFTMGRGFQLQAEDKGAQALWNAFVEANDLMTQFDFLTREISIYGEVMEWWLPNNNARPTFMPAPGEKVPKALIPRIRLIDPSNIAEIITIPEDISTPLYYVWLAPTQYQMFTRDNQPSTKFIYTQIPANQIIHEKINCVSNEKRGRSDFFPALGYMKRLRDGINYELVAQQKAAAWCIDTTINGNTSDVDLYMSQQESMGQVPPAGSEFVHTAAVKREYLSNSITSSKESPLFSWCLSMAAMAHGVPFAWLGTHISGAGNRASALVSTEPVAKKLERRRLKVEKIAKRIFKGLCDRFNIESECDIIFPELITQDRSAKFNDLLKAQNASWISHERAATMAASEFDIKKFNYEKELTDIKSEDKELGISPAMTNPLSTPGTAAQNKGNSSLTGPEKRDIKQELSNL